MKNIKFLEENGINIKDSLGVFGSSDVYNERLGEFLVDVHTKINQLIVFMQKKDMRNYTDCVNSMASDAEIYGFVKLKEKAKEHAEHSSKADQYFINKHINDLITECNNTIKLIQEYMNGIDEKKIEKLDSEVVEKKKEYEKRTILVVDDSNLIRSFVEKNFGDEFNVGTAKNGEEAIKLLSSNKENDTIKAILLDLNMPKVDGFGVLEYMRENDLLEKIPVSIITGDSSKKTIERAFTYDIVDMLNKPFNISSVRSVVEKTLMYSNEK